MHCPFCKHDQTQVIDSRTSEDGTTIRRRRRCLKCEKRFTTYERVELSMPSIIKRGGGRCEYDQKKLRSSMMLALRKRPVSRERVDEAINRIEQKMLALGERDKVAYVRFASVYRNFEDVQKFADMAREV